MEEHELFRGRIAVSIDETGFKRFFLDDNLLQAIAESGYEELTPFQEKVVPPLLERENVIAQASRGMGKTAAYLVPIIHGLSGRMGPRTIIITPTRDLAIQVYNEVRRLCNYMDKRSCLIDPGSSINQQARILDDDPEILIGTPGRILDHMRRGNLKVEDLDCLILDEVDRMLDHGQRPDVEAIVRKIYHRDQTVVLSSTISPPVLRMCRMFAEDANEFFIAPEKPTVEAVRHSYFRVESGGGKIGLIHRLVEREQPERAIVFCRTKVGASSVADRLRTVQGGAMELHMGMAQRKQEQIIKRFREKEFNILVTTDTFTRELDVENISHVLNFDIPEDPEDYTFRIGKTACLGTQGRAMTLVAEEEQELLKAIEDHIGVQISEEVIPGLEPKPAQPERAKPAVTEKTATATPEILPKPAYFHGGWHRKRPRRGR